MNSKTWYPCLEIHTNNVLCPGCRSIWCHIERCCSENYRFVSNMILLIEFYKDYWCRQWFCSTCFYKIFLYCLMHTLSHWCNAKTRRRDIRRFSFSIILLHNYSSFARPLLCSSIFRTLYNTVQYITVFIGKLLSCRNVI